MMRYDLRPITHVALTHKSTCGRITVYACTRASLNLLEKGGYFQSRYNNKNPLGKPYKKVGSGTQTLIYLSCVARLERSPFGSSAGLLSALTF